MSQKVWRSKHEKWKGWLSLKILKQNKPAWNIALFNNCYFIFAKGLDYGPNHVQVNCSWKWIVGKKFGLVCQLLAEPGSPNVILQLTFGLQFTFSCNSLVHDTSPYLFVCLHECVIVIIKSVIIFLQIGNIQMIIRFINSATVIFKTISSTFYTFFVIANFCQR